MIEGEVNGRRPHRKKHRNGAKKPSPEIQNTDGPRPPPFPPLPPQNVYRDRDPFPSLGLDRSGQPARQEIPFPESVVFNQEPEPQQVDTQQQVIKERHRSGKKRRVKKKQYKSANKNQAQREEPDLEEDLEEPTAAAEEIRAIMNTLAENKKKDDQDGPPTPQALQISYKKKGFSVKALPNSEDNQTSLEQFYIRKPDGARSTAQTKSEPKPPSTLPFNEAPNSSMFNTPGSQFGAKPSAFKPQSLPMQPFNQITSPAENLAPVKSPIQTQEIKEKPKLKKGKSKLKMSKNPSEEPEYGRGAGRLFGKSRIRRPKLKPFAKLKDEEKMRIEPNKLKDFSFKQVNSVFKLVKKFYEANQAQGDDRIAIMNTDPEDESVVDPSVLLYAYEQQGTRGNFKRKYKVKTSFFELKKRRADTVWKSLKGMKKKDALTSYIEAIQTAYNLIEDENEVVEEVPDTGDALLIKMPMPQSLGNNVTNLRKSSMVFNKKVPKPQERESMMRTLSVRLSANFSTPGSIINGNPASAGPQEGPDPLTSNLAQYRKTITRGEFDRFSIMKMKKADEENKEVQKRLQSLKIDLKPEDIAKMEQTGTGLNPRQIQSIRLVESEFSVEDQKADLEVNSDWSISDSDDSEEFIPKTTKKKKFNNHLGNRKGEHEEIPREMQFRNSLAPYNSVRKIIDLLCNEVQDLMVPDPGFTIQDAFSQPQAPTIKLEDYLFRLARYMDAWFYEAPSAKSVGCRSLVMAVIFFYRLRSTSKEFFITMYNVHRLFAVCTLVAAKFYEDYIVSHSYWAEVSGISGTEINSIEELLCSSMNFNFYITQSELKKFYRKRKFPET